MRVRLLTAAAAVTFCHAARDAEAFSINTIGAISMPDHRTRIMPPLNGNLFNDFSRNHLPETAITIRAAVSRALDAEEIYVPASISDASMIDHRLWVGMTASTPAFDNSRMSGGFSGNASSAPGVVIGLGRAYAAGSSDQLNFQPVPTLSNGAILTNSAEIHFIADALTFTNSEAVSRKSNNLDALFLQPLEHSDVGASSYTLAPTDESGGNVGLGLVIAASTTESGGAIEQKYFADPTTSHGLVFGGESAIGIERETNGNSSLSLVNTGDIANAGRASNSGFFKIAGGQDDPGLGGEPVAGNTADSVVDSLTISAISGVKVVTRESANSLQLGRFIVNPFDAIGMAESDVNGDVTTNIENQQGGSIRAGGNTRAATPNSYLWIAEAPENVAKVTVSVIAKTTSIVRLGNIGDGIGTTTHSNTAVEVDSADNYLAGAIQTANGEYGEDETYVALIDHLFNTATGSIVGSIDTGGNDRPELNGGTNLGHSRETANAQLRDAASDLWRAEGGGSEFCLVGITALAQLAVGEYAARHTGIGMPHVELGGLHPDFATDTETSHFIDVLREGAGPLHLSGHAIDTAGLQHTGETFADNGELLLSADIGDIATSDEALFQLASSGDFNDNLINNDTLVVTREDDTGILSDFTGATPLARREVGTHLFDGHYDLAGTTFIIGSLGKLTDPLAEDNEAGLAVGGTLEMAHIEGGRQTIVQPTSEGGTFELGESQLAIDQSDDTRLTGEAGRFGTIQTEGEDELMSESDRTGVTGASEGDGSTMPEIRAVQDGVVDAQARIFGTQDSRFASPAAPVETLQQALERTYKTSPTLMAQRAELRGLDNRVAGARAALNPQITIGAGFSQEMYTTRVLGTRGRGISAGAEVEQVLFSGGRIRNSIRAADTRVIAGRADLRATEGEVFTEAVGAYADLLRDREILEFNLNQVRVLEANLNTTRARFNLRDLTKTDVAQSEARLSRARSELATAEGRLQVSEENFERVVGARAGVLEPLPPLPPMPPTADHAVETALAENADVAALVALARVAGYEVAATRGERWPTISVGASSAYSNALGTADEAAGLPRGTLPNSATDVVAGFSLRFPLYQGGAVSARVRQADEARIQLTEQAIAGERLAVASARAAFATWRSSLSAIAANQSAVASNEVALQSVKIEQTVGARSILDVLNAEQELLDSRIELAGAQRDAYVAAFALLNIMGAAEAADLNLGIGPLYDPGVNYREYAQMWSDWADGPRRTPDSTRTVPEHVNSPLTRLGTGEPLESEKRP